MSDLNMITQVLIYSLTLSLVLAIIYRLLTKPDEIRRLKEELNDYRKKIKSAQKSGNTQEANKLLSDMMKINQKQLRSNMKPMLVSMILFFVVIGFFRDAFTELVIQLPFVLPLFSYSFPFILIRESIGWFWWYVFITVPCTFLFRKLLGVE